MSLWVIGGIGGVIFIAAVVPGMLLWWPARHRRDARSGFGVSLVTGAVVALAIFALQMMFEMRLDHVDQQRQRQAGRQNLELTIGLQTKPAGHPARRRSISRTSSSSGSTSARRTSRAPT